MNQVDPDALVRAVSIVYFLPRTLNIGSVYVGVEVRHRHGGTAGGGIRNSGRMDSYMW